MTTNLFDITTPAFGGKPVRTANLGWEIWFCAMNVFDALGLKGDTQGNTKLYGIGTGEVRVITKTQANPGSTGIKVGYPNRGLTFINATAVRRIAQRSNTPAAREFQTFMNKTVAGAIEKDGAYFHPAVAQEVPDLAALHQCDDSPPPRVSRHEKAA